MDDGTKRAPAGHVYVCLACGETSPTRYGFDEHGRNIAMPGWDESCAMNCDLFREEDIEEKAPSGRVMRFRPGAEPVHS